MKKLLGSGLAVALLAALALVSFQLLGGQHTASAQVPLIMGIDPDTTGNSCAASPSNCHMGTIERCVRVNHSGGFDGVSDYNIDVYIDDPAASAPAPTAYDAWVYYDQTLVHIASPGTNGKIKIDGAGNFTLGDELTLPDADGFFAGGWINIPPPNPTPGVNTYIGDGPLLRLGLDIDGTKSGVVTFYFDETVSGYNSLAGNHVLTFKSGQVAINTDCPADTDGDTVPDDKDNCPSVYNPGQEDNDGDGAGDLCDADDDNDLAFDADDNCPTAYNPGGFDIDGDLIGDACDPDKDGDGFSNDVDNCDEVANPTQADADNDGLGDACDPSPLNGDMDADTVADGVDNCPTVPNGDQTDLDEDGVGEACDVAMVNPDDNDLVSGVVELSAAPPRADTPLTSATFQYKDGTDWITVGTDTDGSAPSRGCSVSVGAGDGWTVPWDTSGLAEGFYPLRVSFDGPTGLVGQDVVVVYLDPTPPIPTAQTPDDGAVLDGVVPLSIGTSDENVVLVRWDLLKGADLAFTKGVKEKSQRQPDKWPNPDASCGPVSATVSFEFFAERSYPKLMQKKDGTKMTQEEVVKELQQLTGQGPGGVGDDPFVTGLRDYIEKHGGRLTVTRIGSPTFKDYKIELEAWREDVLVSTPYHWMVGNSVNDTKNADGTFNVDFMDPWRGKIINTVMKENGEFKYDFEKPEKDWTFQKFDSKIMISPKPVIVDPPIGPVKPPFLASELNPEYALISVDTDPSDGFTATWDTTGLAPGVYFLRETLVDSTNRFTQTTKIVTVGGPSGGVGGIVELPVDGSRAPASATAGSGASPPPYAIIAGAAAAAALVVTGGGWYVRRRFSRG